MNKPKIIIFSSMNGRKCFPHMSLSGKIYAFFELNGYQITNNIYESDYVIINTCAFDESSEQESISEINKLYEKFHCNNNRLIVIGCLPDISYGNQDWKQDKILISDRNLEQLHDYFDCRVKINDVEQSFAHSLKAQDAGKENISYDSSIEFDKNLFYIEISKGCDQFCSYCSIKKAKGNPKSKIYKDIVNEIQRGIYMGYNDFFFVSDDCGSYGYDIKTNIKELLIKLHHDFADIKIHINYLEPGSFLKYFIDLDKNILMNIQHINIPLQSLSQKLLDAMNRKYEINEVINEIQKFKINNPHCKLSNQMIYGFPEETDDEFKKSLKVLDIFDSTSFFCFTPKVGTIAGGYKMLDDIILYKRTLLLYKISKSMRYETYMHLSESKYKSLILKNKNDI